MMSRAAIGALILLINGCATFPATVIVHTDPPGGTVQVEGTGQLAADGSTLALDPGAYRFTGKAAGYRAATLEAEVLAGPEQRLTVPLGPGFARVELRAQPKEAEIRVADQYQGKGTLSAELDAGDYPVEIALEGFESQRHEIRVEPGVPVVRAYRLEPVAVESTLEAPTPPTHGRVRVVPQPPTAMILFRERELGSGAQDLGALSPGGYRVSGIATVSAYQRLTGEREFSVQAGDETRIELRLERRERRFEGKWLSETEALRREDARYQSQRVGQPMAVEVYPVAGALDALRQQGDLPEALFALLRVGDRLTVHALEGPWRIWKRHAEPTAEFAASVDALRAGAAHAAPWADDPVRSVRVQAATEPLAAVAFALHGARSGTPHLDLDAAQLEPRGERVAHSQADGALTLVVHGGQGIELPGAPVQAFGNLRYAEIAPANSVIELRWQATPERVLLVGDQMGPVRVPETPRTLLRGQREWRILAPDVRVQRLVRLSDGPDFEGWQREAFDTSGPLGFQLDLTGDEIGPHEAHGAYRRIWLLEYEQGGSHSQRQIAVEYHVAADARNSGPEEFIRRID